LKASQRKAIYAKSALTGASKNILLKMKLDNLHNVHLKGNIGKESRKLNKDIAKELRERNKQ